MAERKKRGTRDRENTASRRGTQKSKKKKVNLLPAVAVCVMLIVVFAVYRAVSNDGGSGVSDMLFSGQPEFFSTIKPEKLNSAQSDLDEDAEFFSGGLIVGGADVRGIQNAMLENSELDKLLGKALFMTSDSYTWKSMKDEFSGGALTFNLYGEYVSLVSAIEKTSAKTVFLQMGREELAQESNADALIDAQTALLCLQQACPDVKIVLLAITPNRADSEVVPDNAAIQSFNGGMRAFCANSGITFADTSSVFPAEGISEGYCVSESGSGAELSADGYLAMLTTVVDNTVLPITSAPSQTTENTVIAENGMNAAGRTN